MMRLLAGCLAAVGCISVQPVEAGELLVGVSRSAHEIVVIDPETARIVARHPTGRGPHEIALSPDRRIAYVPNLGSYPAPHASPREGPPAWIREPSATLSRIDLATGEGALWPLEQCRSPHGVEVSADGQLLWVTCEDTSSVQELDTRNGRLLRRWITGQSGSHELAASPDERLLFVANTSGASVTIIARDRGVLSTVPTGQATEGMALSEDRRHLFVLAAAADRLSVIDIERLEVVSSMRLDTRFPISLVVPPGRGELWIAGNQSNEILIIDSTNFRLRGRIPLGTQPLGMMTDAAGNRVYVSLPRRNEIVALGTGNRRELRRFEGVMEGDGLALTILPADQVSTTPTAMTTTAAADGTNVHIYEYRPAGEQVGTPLLLFHQAGGDARGELGPIAHRLAAAGRLVFTADLRAGGDRFGSPNRTAAGYAGERRSLCDAYIDAEAALDHVAGRLGRPVTLVGSSYSAALVVKLAALHPERVAGFVGFSPAGGEAMRGCVAEDYLSSLRVPGLAVRAAASAHRVDWVAASNRQWREAGLEVLEVSADGHGASLLVPDRAQGEVAPTWRGFLEFLRRVDERGARRRRR